MFDENVNMVMKRERKVFDNNDEKRVIGHEVETYAIVPNGFFDKYKIY